MENKAGIKTTEFWVTLIVALFPILQAFGLFGEMNAVEFQETVGGGAGGVAAAIAAAVYIWSRAHVKGKVVKEAGEVERELVRAKTIPAASEAPTAG
jgi:uncharacterized protein (DUF697 family)